MATKMMIGVVKLFENGRGVIAPKDPSGSDELRDLYFAPEDKTVQFRTGQLVKFVKDESGSRARDVAVLSENY